MQVETKYPHGAMHMGNLIDIMVQVADEGESIKIYMVIPSIPRYTQHVLTRNCVIENGVVYFDGNRDGASLLDCNVFKNPYNDIFLFDNRLSAMKYLEHVTNDPAHVKFRKKLRKLLDDENFDWDK
jgi:hypothetical protein